MNTILVVDDHDDIRDLLTRRLQQHGFAVTVARNGLEAVAAATSQPALILMDVNMPELDGFEATAKIRQNAEQDRVPIIALTAHALPGDEARSQAAGCDAFHCKPINFEKLFDQIEDLIGGTTLSTDGLSTNDSFPKDDQEVR
jgi:two-component system cell cycle response regulator DivK